MAKPRKLPRDPDTGAVRTPAPRVSRDLQAMMGAQTGNPPILPGKKKRAPRRKPRG